MARDIAAALTTHWGFLCGPPSKLLVESENNLFRRFSQTHVAYGALQICIEPCFILKRMVRPKVSVVLCWRSFITMSPNTHALGIHLQIHLVMRTVLNRRVALASLTPTRYGMSTTNLGSRYSPVLRSKPSLRQMYLQRKHCLVAIMNIADQQLRSAQARYNRHSYAQLCPISDIVLSGDFVIAGITFTNQPHKLDPIDSGSLSIVSIDTHSVTRHNTVRRQLGQKYFSQLRCEINGSTYKSYSETTACSP